MIRQPLDLQGREPVTRGSHRAIYDLDEAPRLLLKVPLCEQDLDQRWLKRVKRWWKRRFGLGAYRSLIREYHYYLRIKLAQQGRPGALPISELRGLVATSEGVGLLVEKVVDEHGRLARRLDHLSASGELAASLEELNDFARTCFEWNLVASDINAANIVLGWRDGTRQFVLVDGWGDSHLVPLRTWVAAINRRHLQKRFRTVARKCGLQWDAGRKQFAMP